MSSRVLVVTNDFPPRQGGIETFVRSLAGALPPDQVVVYASTSAGAAPYDEGLEFPVVRDRGSTLLPTPRATRAAVAAMRRYGCDRVVFGAAAPLGLMAPALRSAGARRIVGLTHGHEAWWASVLGSRRMLHRIGEQTDVLTYVSGWCRERIAPALSAAAAARMRRLAPGVDTEQFRPGAGAELRARMRLTGRPVVVCVSRLIARKGQDTLIRAWSRVLDSRPDAVLVLVGGGPDRARLADLAERTGVAHAVRFTGPVPWAEVAPYTDLADVFALACRTRRFGLEPEALGIVLLEAAACGKPVLAGDSGGTADAVRHGETGFLVDPYNPVAVAARLTRLLADPAAARAMGERGRDWVRAEWTWQRSAAVLAELLEL